MSKIGRLTAVPVREAWKHEAHHFTPWLADNLDHLADVIGIELEPEGVEVAVSGFSADILAQTSDGRRVLIENQLETTDHTHLGQVLTYLSGLDAEVVIWIASDFREAHLSAVNWLNDNTVDPFAFFAARLRVVRIGDSAPAPIFDVLARPNAWDRQLKEVVRAKTGESSEFATTRREFWQHYLARYPEDAARGVKVTGSASNWMALPEPIGLVVSLYRAKDGVGVFLRGPRGSTAADIHARLKPVSEAFAELAGDLTWPGSETDHPGESFDIDTENRANWDEAVEWLHDSGHSLFKAALSLFE